MVNSLNERVLLLTSIMSITVIHCTQQELSARRGGLDIKSLPKKSFQQIFSLSVQLSDNMLPNSCNIYWKDKEFVYHTYLATPFLILKIWRMVIMPM